MADNTNVTLNIILNQVQVAEALASSTLPHNHPIVLVLKSAVQSVTLAVNGTAPAQAPETAPVAPVAEVKAPVVDDEPLVPLAQAPVVEQEPVDEADALNLGFEDIRIAGLTPDDFFQVMEEVPEDIARIFAGGYNEDGEDREDREDRGDFTDEIGIHGVIEKDGEFVEVGDFAANAARMQELIEEVEAEQEEMGEEIREPEHAINIRYTRLDGQALSVEDTLTILNHPVSRPLKNLGKLRFDSILEGEESATKIARFEIEDATRTTLVGMAMGAIAYAGIKVFPGLGQVQATGYVNFDF